MTRPSEIIKSASARLENFEYHVEKFPKVFVSACYGLVEPFEKVISRTRPAKSGSISEVLAGNANNLTHKGLDELRGYTGQGFRIFGQTLEACKKNPRDSDHCISGGIRLAELYRKHVESGDQSLLAALIDIKIYPYHDNEYKEKVRQGFLEKVYSVDELISCLPYIDQKKHETKIILEALQDKLRGRGDFGQTESLHFKQVQKSYWGGDFELFRVIAQGGTSLEIAPWNVDQLKHLIEKRYIHERLHPLCRALEMQDEQITDSALRLIFQLSPFESTRTIKLLDNKVLKILYKREGFSQYQTTIEDEVRRINALHRRNPNSYPFIRL